MFTLKIKWEYSFHTFICSPAFSKILSVMLGKKKIVYSVPSPFLCESHKITNLTNPSEKKISSNFYRTFASFLLITLLLSETIFNFYGIHIISYNFMQGLVECAGAHTAGNIQISRNNKKNLNYLLLNYPYYVMLTYWDFLRLIGKFYWEMIRV